MKSRTLRSLCVILFLTPGVLVAQESAVEGSEELFIETVDVNVVNVDVFVTDKQGNPVTGLTAEDFEVLQDRRPIQISNFYAVEEGRPRRTVGEDPAAAAGAAVSAAGVDLPLLPDDQRLYLIVYVDNFNIRPFNRNRVLRQVRQFLHERVGVADQVMLVSYDRSLHVRHPFTSDPALIGRALFELEDLTGHALSQDSERREIIQAIDEARSVTDVEWRVRQFAESLSNDLAFSTSALREFVDSLSGLEGRKAILYVSDGLQMTSAEDLFQVLAHKFVNSGSISRMQDFNALSKFRELAALASSNRVSFYTIDAAGLRTSTISGAQSRGTMDPTFTTVLESTYRNNLQAPLRLLAGETGGQAVLNTNDWSAGLDRMNADFETFYSLGYMPGTTNTGRYHRIDVRLKEGKGLKVRHRKGYRSKSLHDRMTDGTRSAMLYGFERNPLGVNFRFGSGEPQASGLFLVRIAIDIPIGKLELVPRGDMHIGRVKVYFAAIDGEERMSDMQEVPISVEIPASEIEVAKGRPYVYQAELQMRGGSQRMAVGVRDEIGSVESFIVRSMRIGK